MNILSIGECEEKEKSYLEESFEDAIREAGVNGCEVIKSTETTLLLDFDNGAQQDQFTNMFRRLKDTYGLKEVERWASKSGRGVHVAVSMKEPLNVTERLLLQCALGSDPMREALGLKLVKSGVENPIMLFKPKVKL